MTKVQILLTINNKKLSNNDNKEIEGKKSI